MLIIFYEFKFSFKWTIFIVVNSYLCSSSISYLLIGGILNSLDPKDLIDCLRFEWWSANWIDFYYLRKFAFILVSICSLLPTFFWQFRFIWTIKFVYFHNLHIGLLLVWTSLFLRLILFEFLILAICPKNHSFIGLMSCDLGIFTVFYWWNSFDSQFVISFPANSIVYTLL